MSPALPVEIRLCPGSGEVEVSPKRPMAALGFSQVFFTGGEPFVLNDIDEVNAGLTSGQGVTVLLTVDGVWCARQGYTPLAWRRSVLLWRDGPVRRCSMAMPGDPWSNPSEISAEDAARMAAFLEDRAACTDQAVVNAALCDTLAPRPGERIVEVGCGTGVLCRLAAPHLLPGGEMLGLDVAPEMVAAARALAGGLPHLRFEIGSAEALPCEDATCDAAFAARLLLHVADPVRVVHEMTRVVKPDGRIVLMDWDFESVVVTHPDRELTRRLLHRRCDHHGGDNWGGRRLLGYALGAGLRDVTVIPVATAARDEAAALTGSLFRAAEVARNNCGITPAEHDAWTGELKRQLAEGQFLACITYFIVRGQRD